MIGPKTILLACNSAYIVLKNAFNFQALCAHVEEQEIDGYTEEVKKYDSISRLDSWYTTLLLRIKKNMGSGNDLLQFDMYKQIN